MKTETKQRNPRWIMSLRDLAQTRGRREYLVDRESQIVVSKRWREMLETLRQGPVYCASPVRLSDAVCVLRREYCVNIETLKTDEGRMFYALASEVTEVGS